MKMVSFEYGKLSHLKQSSAQSFVSSGVKQRYKHFMKNFSRLKSVQRYLCDGPIKWA